MSNPGPENAQSRKQAFEQLVNQYQTALLRMCCLYLRDKTLAEDAVQETFIKAWRSMDAFRGDSSEKNLADENRHQHLPRYQSLGLDTLYRA